MSEAKGVLRNIADKGKGLANKGLDKGRGMLDAGKQKAVESGQKGIEKAQEAGQQTIDHARGTLQARIGRQANETIKAVDGTEDQIIAFASAEPDELIGSPSEYLTYKAQLRLYDHEAGVNATGQTLTQEQKDVLLRNMRTAEADKFVTEFPEKAQAYAANDEEIRAALDRQENKRADSLPPVSGASDDDIDKLPEDVFADHENSTRDKLPEPAPMTEGVTDEIVDILSQEDPDVGASLDVLVHDPAAEAAMREFLADPTDERAEAVIAAALDGIPLEPAPEADAEDIPLDSAPIVEAVAGDGSGDGDAPPPDDTDHDDHAEEDGDGHGTGADHGAHDEHGHHGSKINWKKIGMYASNALLVPAVPIINPKTVGWSERGIHQIQEYLETHPNAAKRIRRFRTAALVALVIYIGGLNLAGKALK
jgi:hypothetical protein